VLTGTVNRGSNLKHIVNKVLIQICAKIGGIPWVIDDMPLLNEPTMICGMKMMV
jgi:aubergine-like protein